MNLNKKLNVGYLISQYPAISHTFILREVRKLREKGVQISVASINQPNAAANEYSPEEKEELKQTFYVKKQGVPYAFRGVFSLLFSSPFRFFRGLKACFCHAGFDLAAIAKQLCYFVEALAIGNWMQRRQLTHLHVHFGNPAATVALIMTHLFPFTFSMTVHGSDIFYDVTLNLLKEKIEGAHFICCVSHFCLSQLMRISRPEQWKKMEVIPLGVDPKFFKRKKGKQTSLLQLLTVGRLVSVKGFYLLMEAVRQLREKGKNISLEIVGEGPEREGLERFVADHALNPHVHFKGALNQKRTLEAYQKADIFCLPSFSEGVPVVLMEAMAMEIPCVATRITGIPELIQDHKSGVLVTPASLEALTEALEYLIDDADARQKMGEAGRARILEAYNLDANIEKLRCAFLQRL